MCMVDIIDGVFMMVLYINKVFFRDIVVIFYYFIVFISIIVFVLVFIGVIQWLFLIDYVVELDGSFWDGVGVIGDYYEIIGVSICGFFFVVGIGLVLVYCLWRRRMDWMVSVFLVFEVMFSVNVFVFNFDVVVDYGIMNKQFGIIIVENVDR